MTPEIAPTPVLEPAPAPAPELAPTLLVEPLPAGLPHASISNDLRLGSQPLALDRETPLSDRSFTANVFAAYGLSSGPLVGGSVGMFRAFEFHLGVLADARTQTMTPTTTTKTTELRGHEAGCP